MKYHYILAIILSILISCSKNVPDHSGLYRQIKSVDKLVLSSMSVTKTAILEDEEWYTMGKRVAAYSYDTHLRAFIDLSRLQSGDITFDEVNKTATISLPAVEIEIAGRDMEMKKVYENIGLLRSDLDARERQIMKEKANASLQAEIEGNPVFRKRLIESARRKARAFFGEIFESAGYSATIEFD